MSGIENHLLLVFFTKPNSKSSFGTLPCATHPVAVRVYNHHTSRLRTSGLSRYGGWFRRSTALYALLINDLRSLWLNCARSKTIWKIIELLMIADWKQSWDNFFDDWRKVNCWKLDFVSVFVKTQTVDAFRYRTFFSTPFSAQITRDHEYKIETIVYDGWRKINCGNLISCLFSWKTQTVGDFRCRTRFSTLSSAQITRGPKVASKS